MNLYNNLVEVLSSHGKTVEDIDFVTCRDEQGKKPVSNVNLSNFIEAAKNTEWDEWGYSHELNEFLKIYGKNRDFVIRIGEYDGQMYLDYIDFSVEKPKKTMKFKTFHVKPVKVGLLSKLFKYEK